MSLPDNSITIWTCERHGRSDEPCEFCGQEDGFRQPAPRTYVAVDALLSDEAVEAAYEALTDTAERGSTGDAIRAAIAVASTRGRDV